MYSERYMTVILVIFNFGFLLLLFLLEKKKGGGETERKIIHPMSYSVSDHNDWCCSKLKPGARRQNLHLNLPPG